MSTNEVNAQVPTAPAVKKNRRGITNAMSISGCMKNREEFILLDSEVSGGVSGIYGEIVNGISEEQKNGYSFICTNNTFTDCRRTNSYWKMNAGNRERRIMNEEYSYTSIKYSTRRGLSPAHSYSFTRCSFTNCSTTNYGGGICFMSNFSTTQTLAVTDCTFTSCSASISGGGLFCMNSSIFVVSGCSFRNCSNSPLHLLQNFHLYGWKHLKVLNCDKSHQNRYYLATVQVAKFQRTIGAGLAFRVKLL